MKFSTRDKDNDISTYSCARQYKGAWWFTSCLNSDLNGLYMKKVLHEAIGVMWYHWKGFYYSLKFTEMKIRPQ